MIVLNQDPSQLADKENVLSTTQPRTRFNKFHKLFAYLFLSSLTIIGLKIYYGPRLKVFEFDLHNKGRLHAHRPHSPDFLAEHLKLKDREALFLSIPNGESAHGAARVLSTHPHLTGSSQDFIDAKFMLDLFHKEFNVPPPQNTPIYQAGSPESRNATLGLSSFKSSSKAQAWIDVYYPYIDRPLDRSLQILDDAGRPVWDADLVEDGDPLDKDAHQFRDYIPTWLGYSFDGEAEGKLIYANYGLQEDYAELVASGANFTDKIVIVRYGSIFRGLKIKGAEELGAAGVLIYSDPRDDGYVTVENGYDYYPKGPARNPTSVQRGSSMYLSVYPGDPLTPGTPAYKDAERQDATNIPGIPALPISWENAQRLLEEIGTVYEDRVGKDGKRVLSGRTSESIVRISNHVDAKVAPIWNTMASIPGHIRDEVVLIGCHRDAWVLGAADPVSGTVSLHEIIRGFGALLRKGWKPLRTVVFASWDGEEQGLLGSIEYGEDFPEWLSEHVAAYLNVDVSVSGSQWGVGGSPSLAHLLKQAALEIPHPFTDGKSLWDAREDEGPYTGSSGVYNGSLLADVEYLTAYEAQKKAKKELSTGVSPLGSGSDFTVFLQRIGIASTDQGFGPTPYDPVYHYHSIYDSLRWQEEFADPEFARHVTVAKHMGLVALRLIDGIILPLNTSQYALELDDYLDKVETLASSVLLTKAIDLSNLRQSIRNLQKASARLDDEKEEARKEFQDLLDQISSAEPGVLQRVADWVAGVPEEAQQAMYTAIDANDAWENYLAFELADNGLTEEHTRKTGHPHARPPPPHLPFPVEKIIKAAKRVAKANKKLRSFERGFISEGGIKDREWYKHLGVAPGKWLGYGATTLPALTEAITIEKNTTLAKYEETRLVELLDNLAKQIQP